MKKIFLILTFLVASFNVFADIEKTAIKGLFDSQPFVYTDTFYGKKYSDSEISIGWIDSADAIIGGKTVNLTFGSIHGNAGTFRHSIIYYKTKTKTYVGILQPMTDTVDAIEFDDPVEATKLFYTWTYLSFLEATDKNLNVIYIPGDKMFYNEEEEALQFTFPKDIIEDEYPDYTYFNNGSIYIDGEWHDLKDGQPWEFKGHVFTLKDGHLMDTDKPVMLLDDINKRFRLMVYHNSTELYKRIKENGYYVCDKCWTFTGPFPVEVRGSHTKACFRQDGADGQNRIVAIIPDAVVHVK